MHPIFMKPINQLLSNCLLACLPLLPLTGLAQPTLVPPVYEKIPAGQIRAEGWLKTQLNRQISGLSGHLDEIWDDVGTNSAWLGGTGEAWERGPYYLRGIQSLAYVTQHPAMLAKTNRWIEAILKSQRADGYFGPQKDEDWWPRWLVAQIMISHYETTGDARVIPFLQQYYAFEAGHLKAKPLKSWAMARGGEDISSILWLYRKTKQPELLALARLVESQTNPWVSFFEKTGPVDQRTDIDTTRWLDDSPIHGVNIAHGLKFPALAYQLSGGRASDKQAFYTGLNNLKKYHWQVWGVPVGDEKVRAMGCSKGSETCQTVEFMHSMEYNLRVFGDAALGDVLERAAYNALPAFFDPQFETHPYYILPNSVSATVQPRPFPNPHNGDVLTYGVISGYPCCTVNMHMGYPLLTEHLWLKTADGNGLIAAVYAPSVLTTRLANGQAITIREETDYPFSDQITLVLQPARPMAFPLQLRIPGWCKNAEVRVNGKPAGHPSPDTFLTLNQTWKPGDRVTLRLPMTPQITRWQNNALSVERGPLVYALAVKEDWKPFTSMHTPKPTPNGWYSYEIRASSPWNYGLVLGSDATKAFKFAGKPIGAGQLPWDPDFCPVRLTANGRRILNWKPNNFGLTDPLPQSPVASTEPVETVTLLPVGATRLRIAEIPEVANQ
ncbi:beta-L-arabinofuranosidase domain-containing protein [Spirosoma montaniterrae]|uniref:DUF1680 family protein n=1 Tax=Spirosoma montaniterrae TaxID=1178516 RepID=A0A1P9X033_9BACT|nr:beta-L-arabinofuranosidase domain-containing protein [Spirosoma montaniterrae]AQG80974.1 hypothetical protein AWR27_17575 [Spirosoma montaniterrae]